MASKKIGLEQPILVELNKVVYTLKSLSFHKEFKGGREVYIETFSKLELTPEELEVLVDAVEDSNLRFMKPIKYYCEGETLPFVVML